MVFYFFIFIYFIDKQRSGTPSTSSVVMATSLSGNFLFPIFLSVVFGVREFIILQKLRERVFKNSVFFWLP